jgi:hypothetical protein
MVNSVRAVWTLRPQQQQQFVMLRLFFNQISAPACDPKQQQRFVYIATTMRNGRQVGSSRGRGLVFDTFGMTTL